MAAINMREEINDHVERNASYWMALFIVSACVLEILGVSSFLCKQKDKLKKKKNKKVCGYMYEELQYHIWGGWTLFYPILLQLRLFLIAYVTIYLKRFMVL
mmetsp:Transcript_34941/g.42829  ORF Transcript_34941/g.42829 Transcript_34941/m.42829 type:complete len:101 (-) Transcript_34941:1058-1360(-)|eukprot:CAMPEP_0170456218 /NCGR_PEP_ID=MMETSP0123-20130129/3931_1 /TAXON_ID=182087 /ORGANISM="Favella ehrenbergii, Strain Fehren 1" /LENGTH=100 /DNA_ID=CAMNT_0010719633 /DNA_START=1732 /DNA_END=2034 /DNA_ORIENTATION=+